MRILRPISGLLLVLALVVFASFAESEETKPSPDLGKKIFIDNKCNTCHSVKALGIQKTSSSTTPPDLSGVGSKHTEDWIVKFLNKQETMNDKKHPKLWTGKPEDLKTLAQWLATLKTKEEPKK